MRRYFREYRDRELKRLRKGGFRKVVSAVTDARMAFSFASESLRQNAIKVHGIQRKVDDLVRSVLGIVRFVVGVGIAVLVYDFFHHHHPTFLDSVLEWEALESVAERIPGYHYEWGIVFLVFAVYVMRQVGRVRRKYSQAAVTLPNGRTANDR